MQDLAATVQAAARDATLLSAPKTQAALGKVMSLLDGGELRAASPMAGEWKVHGWVKQAIVCYLQSRKLTQAHFPPLVVQDLLPVKTQFPKVRVVPPAVARYGSFLAPGAILMGGAYINVGTYIGGQSLIDINASVGSCAQVGRRVHVSAGAVLGGVLEPARAQPVIIEDDVFVGAQAAILEGVRVGKGAVIAAGVTLTASTPVLDITGTQEVRYQGEVPPYSLVIPGTRPKDFGAGTYHMACALIIGKRSEQTDKKVALNEALRAGWQHQL